MSANKQTADGKSVLKELEDLMLFDQSKSSSWPRITILVEAGGDDQLHDDHVTVYPNGRTYDIQRSVDAPVPPEVVDALQQAKTAVMVKDANAATGYSARDVLRFPYRISDSPSQLRYAAWERAKNVHRFTVTETKSSPTMDGKKVLHTVIARYLPAEKVEEAQAIIEWARQEIAKEKEKAAEAKAAVA